jgi:hypothetical protein
MSIELVRLTSPRGLAAIEPVLRLSRPPEKDKKRQYTTRSISALT